MIRMCDDSLVFPLKLIFEACLRQGVFPKVWKRANVVPVHKKNSKNLKQNYRPISLLPILGKILEKLMFDSLYEHLSLHELLNPNQSGFRPWRFYYQSVNLTSSFYLCCVRLQPSFRCTFSLSRYFKGF